MSAELYKKPTKNLRDKLRLRGDTIPEESRFMIPDFTGIGPLRGGLIPQKESILFKESRFTIPFFEESCHL